MFRFDKEEMTKIAEVADLFKVIENDEELDKLRENNDDFDYFVDAIEQAVFDLNRVTKLYDAYLRDEFHKLYVDGYMDTYGFNRED